MHRIDTSPVLPANPSPPQGPNTAAASAPVRFGNCIVDRMRRELWRDGASVEVQPLVFNLLCCLLDRPGQVLTKHELLQILWPDGEVSESALTRAVMKLRRAIADGEAAPPMLVTVHGVGFRFDPRVLEAPASVSHAPSPSVSLRWALLPALDGRAQAPDDGLAEGWSYWLHHLFTREGLGEQLLPMASVMAWQPADRDPHDVKGSLAAACRALGAGLAIQCTLRERGGQPTVDACWADPTGSLREAVFSAGDWEGAALELLKALRGSSPPMPTADPKQGFWQAQVLRCFALEQRGLEANALALLEECLPQLPPSTPLLLMQVRLLRKRMRFEAAEAAAQAALQRHDPLPVADQVALHTELATLATQRGDLQAAESHCDVGMALTVNAEVPADVRVDLQLATARVATFKGDFPLSVQLSEQARQTAVRSGDRALTIRTQVWHSGFQLGARQFDAAGETLESAVTAAAASQMTGLECDAHTHLALVHHSRRDDAACADHCHRAAVLAGAAGDASRLDRAVTRQAIALTDLGRLDDAARLLDERDRQSALRMPLLDNLAAMARARNDWRRGQHALAVAKMQGLFETEYGRAAKMPLRWYVAHELILNLLNMGQREEAQDVWLRCRDDLPPVKRVGIEAALALADGQREQAKTLLGLGWGRFAADTVDAIDLALNLGWLLLEEAHVPNPSAMWARVLAVSQGYAPARLLQRVHSARLEGTPVRPAAWAELVLGIPGLATRHASYAGPAVATAVTHGPLPPLPQVLTAACW